jgi:glycosyltransferase involved in cell wall biosynthesis
MRISCICGTYNRAATRPWLLEEAVESFLRQTHPDRELIILNDHPGQELVCDAPGVRVVNTAPRFPTLGDKFNHGVTLATGDAICEWADDDISLPHRLEQAAELLQAWDYFNPRGYWFIDGQGLHADHPIGYSVNASAYRREAFARAGGANRSSTATDAKLDVAFNRSGARIWPGRQSAREWAYVYRWGVSDYHLSAFADVEVAYEQQAAAAPQGGRFVLRPHWREDYAARCRAALGPA